MKKIKLFQILFLSIIFILIITHLGFSYKNDPQGIRAKLESNTCLCRGDLSHNGVINRYDLKLMLKIIRADIPPISPYECGDLNYNQIPYEIADYVLLSGLISEHHAINCKKLVQ